MQSPPAKNSQLSTVEAVRSVLQKGMVVHQRDLEQAFMGIHVKIEDEAVKKATPGDSAPLTWSSKRPHDFRARNLSSWPL
jgi:hypothetical protein